MKQVQMTSAMLVFILLGWISNAHATCILFTDQVAWQADVLDSGYNITSIDFENATTWPSGHIVQAGDVLFLSPVMPLLVDSSYGIPYNSGNVLYPTHNQPIAIELPGNVYAFGFDLGDLAGPIPSLYSPPTLSDVVLSTGDVFAGPYEGNAHPTFAFFGICSDLPITSLSITPQGSIEAIIDNFSYAQAAVPAPEPSSLLLLSSGVFGFVANIWRNRRRYEER